MNEDTRTKNALRNTMVGIISQVLTLFFNFSSKTLFIYVLGSDYLGFYLYFQSRS